MKLKLLISFIFFFPVVNLFGQFYETGTGKASTHWKQINTGHFKVIFPKGYEAEGNKLANILEKTYTIVSNSLGHELKRKVPVILNTSLAVSNGFVAIAPSRSEFNLIPPQDPYSQDWLEQLAIHESRHMVQLDKINSDVFGLFRILFGEAAAGATAGLFPIWAYEGDAVATETALTFAGRGRSPSFLMGLKTITLENEKPYSYEKAIFGSYKDFVPDYYVYGYAMSATGRIKYDSLIWKEMLHYISRNQYKSYPMYFGLKSKYGLSKQKLYYESINFFGNNWRSKLNNDTVIKCPKINKTDKNDYTSYLFPVHTEKGTIICEKSNKSDINTLIEISGNGAEKKITSPGLHIPVKLSYGGGKLAWNEIIYHPRWEKQQYTVIKIYNTENKKISVINKKTHLVSPDISADGNFIVAVETTTPVREYILIFNTNTEQIERSFPAEPGEAIQTPKWSPDNKEIVYSKVTHEGKCIEILNIETGEKRAILSAVWFDVFTPVFFDKYILFSAGIDNVNNIYAIDTISKELLKATYTKYGAYNPDIDLLNNTLYFNEYSFMGEDISEMIIDTAQWQKIKPASLNNNNIANKLAKQEPDKFYNTPSENIEYNISRYREITHLFNLHSRVPFYVPANFTRIEKPVVHPGFMLFSQNITGTLSGWASYYYKEKYHHTNINFTYRGQYPVVTINFDFGGEPSVVRSEGQTYYPEIMKPDRKEITANTYIPLIFTKGPAILRITPGFEYKYEDIYFYHEGNAQYEEGLAEPGYFLILSAYRKMAARDIYPKIGVTVTSKFINAPFDDNFGSIFYSTGSLFLPGILPNNSMKISARYSIQYYKTYLFPYKLSFPRGYESELSESFKMIGVDYILPLFYPDWRIGTLAYIKRFTGSVFYDLGYVINTTSDDYPSNYKESAGIELSASTHFGHLLLPVEAGLRIGYKTIGGSFFIEPTISVNLNGI